MNITFICPNYPPEPAPSGVMAAQLSQCLFQGGHRVTMVVQFPSRPQGELYPGYHRKLRSVECIGGVRVVRCAAWTVGRHRRHLDRILENVTFGFTGALNAFREGRRDVLIIETWPLVATQLAILLGWFWGVPQIYYVKDVYPEAGEELGVFRKGGLLARGLRAWDRFLCLRSSKIVVIAETMRELIYQRGISPDRVTVIRDWVDGSKFSVRPRNNSWRTQAGICEETFVALFAGTLGFVSGASVLVETAAQLRCDPEVLLICAGEGALKDEMTRRAITSGLCNLKFEPFQPPDKLADMHGAADVLVLTMRGNSADTSVPSKVISYLAAGRPVVCSAATCSAVAQIIAEAKAGIVVAPGDAKGIAEAILLLKNDSRRAAIMGENARRHFEHNFTLARAEEQFVELIEEVAGRRTGFDRSAGA